MSDAVALLTELAQKVADARDAESKAFDAYFMADVGTSEHQKLSDAYELACKATQRAERQLASIAVNHLLGKSI